jgi:hypothetical protein
MLIKAVRRDEHGVRRVVASWNPDRHPRDRHGRFITTGHEVHLADGSTGTVVRAVGSSSIEVRHADGHLQRVAANTVSVTAPNAAGALEGIRFPANRKLTVTHGPGDTPVIGHVTSHRDHLAVQPARGGPAVYIPHSSVNRIMENPGRDGRPGAVRYVRPGWNPGRHAERDTAAQVDQVSARDLQPGDHAMVPHPLTGEPAPGTIVDKRLDGDTIELDVRRADGSVDTAAMDRDAAVDKITGAGAPDDFPDETDTTPAPAALPPVAVKPLPAGTTVARPVLYTYQRRKITALNLDRDRTLPEDLRQAAARIRQRQPLSAGQSAALSAELRERAQAHPSPVQTRSLERAAWRLDAAAAEAHGQVIPEPGIVPDRAAEVMPDGITEGDSIVLPGPDGTLTAMKVRGITSMMGGRVRVLDVEHDDGTIEQRTITGRTRAWLLPDRPDDEPVAAPGPRLEHITPDQLRPGDTIRVSEDHDADTDQVTGVEPLEPGEARITLASGQTQLSQSYDGGPSIVRTARGDASAGQPWDSLMAAEHPETGVGPAEIRVGDRIIHGTGAYAVTGAVVEADPLDIPGAKELTIREDNSSNTTVRLYPGDTVTRLVKADDNAAARIEEEKRRRLADAAVSRINYAISGLLQASRDRDLRMAGNFYGQSHDDLAASISAIPAERALARMDSHIRILQNALMPPDGTPETESAAAEAARRLLPAIGELAERQRADVIASFKNAEDGIDPAALADRHARADPAGLLASARSRVMRQWHDTPPPTPSMAATRAIAEAAAAVRGTAVAPDAAGDIPKPLPDGGALAARIRAYRAQLPADAAGIGRQSVTRAVFATPRLEDLEAGKAPAVELAQVTTPDRAPDGGPGAIAMRHLDTVMAAGRDLDAELQARIAKAPIRIETPEAKAERDELRKKSVEAGTAAFRAYRASMDSYAKAHGYMSAMMLERQGTSAQLAEAREQATKIRAERDREHDEARALYKAALAAAPDPKQYADAQRQAALDILGEVIPGGMGGIGAQYVASGRNGKPLTERGQLVQSMRWAEQHYPASWLKKYRERANYRLGDIQRGHYADSTKEIRLSKDTEKVTGGGDRGRVAVHEAGHAMEYGVPGILPLEDAYLWSRTSSGDIGSRTREKKASLGAGMSGERTYRDEFPEPYSGKDYPGGGKDGLSSAYELLTTGMESLFAGSGYLDPGFRQWLLGTLALVN